MNILPVRYKPAEQRLPADIVNNDPARELCDETDLNNIKMDSGGPAQASRTAIRLSDANISSKFVPPHPDNVLKSYAAESYDLHRADRGYTPTVGRIIDTLA